MGKVAKTHPLDTLLVRDLFKTTPIGIAVENLDGQPLFINPAFCSFVGFNEEELRNKHCVDFSPPEDAQKDWALFTKLKAGFIDHYQLEKRYFRKDGSMVWGNLSVSLSSSHPSPLVIAMVEDITEKKKAEEALLRHAAIVESSNDGISSVNLDGITVTWNPGAQRMFGYTANETVGKPANIIVPPELREQQKEILETLWAGGRIEQLETVRVSKTGKRIDVSLSISPVKDSTGKIVGCAGIARDITERKHAEEARFRHTTIVESSEDAIISKDRDAMITSWNAGAERIFGYAEQEALGKPITILIPPELQDEENRILEKLRAGERIEHYETIRVSKTGRRVPVSLTISPIKDSRGNVTGFSKIARDIAQRKQMEQSLSDMTRKLIHSQEQERSRIGRELHDDINQRLAMLAVELDLLLEHPSEFRTRVQELRNRTIELSSDVQAISHDLHSSKLEFLGVVAGIKSWCREFAERQKLDINFNTDVSSDLSLELGLSLFRVLQEALHNAIKHSGVKRMEVQLREHSGQIDLIVRDSGTGFDVDAALQGNGLGLTSMPSA